MILAKFFFSLLSSNRTFIGESRIWQISIPVVRDNVSYAGDNARARACAPQFVYLSQCVSIASECAKIITRNCEPRVAAAFAGGCRRIIEAHPLPLPAICFIYPITRHYGRIVNAAVPVTIGYL